MDHGGNVYAAARTANRSLNELVDFSASINPVGLPASVQRAIRHGLSRAIHYPDPDQRELRRALGEYHGVDPARLVLGNGSIELIYALPRALGIRHALILGPTFSEYERALRAAGGRCSYVHASSSSGYAPPLRKAYRLLHRQDATASGPARLRYSSIPSFDAVFVCQPNNPTGQALTHREMTRLYDVAAGAGAWLIVDEAFIDFCNQCSVIEEIERWPRLVLLRSFTKAYAMPGLRIGYAIAHHTVIERLRAVLPPWSVNVVAEQAALAALNDESYRRRSLEMISRERDQMLDRLQRVPGLRVVPSSANFLLFELLKGSASRLTALLLEYGIVIRDCTNIPGIRTQALRIAVRTPADNARLFRALRAAFRKPM